MEKKVSSAIAAKSGGQRAKTRFPGVYSRAIANKRTGKPDVAFDICYRDTEGKLRWELIGYKSDGVNASYANQRRGSILEGISRGEKPAAQRRAAAITYAQAWTIFDEKWLPFVARPEYERERYSRYIRAKLAHRELADIRTMDLEDLKASMLARGLSPATVRLVLSDIRRVYRKMAVWGLYSGPMPTTGLVFPKCDNARTRFLNQEEAVRLLAALKKRSIDWHDIAAISLYTGMRKGEILALRGEHLDFTGGRILIKDAKAGSRATLMSDDVRELLLRRKPDSPGDLVFPSSKGEMRKADSDESFVRAVAECGLNVGVTDRRHKVVFHTLRHTFCSWLAIAGVPLFTIGEMVGHASLEMTKRYSHLCPDAKRDAAAHISRMMAAAMGKTTPDHVSSASEIPDTD